MTKKYVLTILAVFVLLFAFPISAFAQGTDGDQVVFGGSYTLESGETLEGDLAVFGGVVVLEDASFVDGDVILFGGTIDVDGEVAGDMVVIGGTVDLLKNAIIQGDLVTIGGSVDREPSAQILGQVITEISGPFVLPFTDFFTPDFTPETVIPRFRFDYNPFWGVFSALVRSLALAAFAVLLVMFLPKQTVRTSNAVTAEPILAGGLGLLTIAVLPPLLLILALVTLLLLSPISILGIFLLVVAAIYGWIAIGTEVGDRLVKLFNWEWPEPVYAGVGTFILTLVALGIEGIIPCIGWIPLFLVTCFAVGGVVLTRFGTQVYPPEVADSSTLLIGSPPEPTLAEGSDEIPSPLTGEVNEDVTEEESPEESS